MYHLRRMKTMCRHSGLAWVIPVSRIRSFGTTVQTILIAFFRGRDRSDLLIIEIIISLPRRYGTKAPTARRWYRRVRPKVNFVGTPLTMQSHDGTIYGRKSSITTEGLVATSPGQISPPLSHLSCVRFAVSYRRVRAIRRTVAGFRKFIVAGKADLSITLITSTVYGNHTALCTSLKSYYGCYRRTYSHKHRWRLTINNTSTIIINGITRFLVHANYLLIIFINNIWIL